MKTRFREIHELFKTTIADQLNDMIDRGYQIINVTKLNKTPDAVMVEYIDDSATIKYTFNYINEKVDEYFDDIEKEISSNNYTTEVIIGRYKNIRHRLHSLLEYDED